MLQIHILLAHNYISREKEHNIYMDRLGIVFDKLPAAIPPY